MTIISELLSKFEIIMKYSFSNKEYKYSPFAQGIILFLLFPFFIPIFILIGYRFKIIESIINKEQAPEFESYDKLFEEGVSGFFVYLPVFALIVFGISLFAIGLPMFLGISIIGLYIWPAISIIYTIKKDYKKVYGADLVNLITQKIYVKTYVGSILLSFILLTLMVMFGTLTIGIGFILLIPIYIYSKPILWGEMYNEYDEMILK